MTNYANQTFYVDDFLCGRQAVITSAFDYYARKATLEIKRFTLDNVSDSDIPDEVKLCCCEVAQLLYSYENSGGESGVTSESVGGWSKSYETDEARSRKLRDDIKNTVYNWLSDTGLLYKGV